MSTVPTHSETRVELSAKQSSLLLVDEIAGDAQGKDSKAVADTKEKGLPFTDDFEKLKKSSAIEQKIANGEALVVDDFKQLLRNNGPLKANEDNPQKTTDAEAIFKMFTKQSAIMEKYTKQLELLEKRAKLPDPVEAITAMAEQTHIQTEAILATVEQEEEDIPEELRHQLEAILVRTEEALERLMGKLKRKAATGQASAKAEAGGPEILTPAGPSSDKD
ncbi:MAG: hypothetical protein Q9168_002712 [Polycauliona sp. 1 TL-2023]